MAKFVMQSMLLYSRCRRTECEWCLANALSATPCVDGEQQRCLRKRCSRLRCLQYVVVARCSGRVMYNGVFQRPRRSPEYAIGVSSKRLRLTEYARTFRKEKCDDCVCKTELRRTVHLVPSCQWRNSNDALRAEELQMSDSNDRFDAETLEHLDDAELAQLILRNASDNSIAYGRPYLEYVLAGYWGHEREHETWTRFLCNANSWRGPIARAVKLEIKRRYPQR